MLAIALLAIFSNLKNDFVPKSDAQIEAQMDANEDRMGDAAQE